MKDPLKLVEQFLENKKIGIKNLYLNYYKKFNKVENDALICELKNILHTSCITFLNKNKNEDELELYLFYISNSFFKKSHTILDSKITEYVCPGCLYFKKIEFLTNKKLLTCDACEFNSKNTLDHKSKVIFDLFKLHNKSGFKCPDCNRFIPKPLTDIKTICCPYLDCCFLGDLETLNIGYHPTKKTKIKSISSKKDGTTFDIISDEKNQEQILEEKSLLLDRVKIIKTAIDSQIMTIIYNSSGFTVKHKELIYKAFSFLLDKFPEEMSKYILDDSRSGGFQHKIFQKYIQYLEESLPIIFMKRKKLYKVESLLDDNINIFQAVEEFDAEINEKLIIKNNTSSIYIGGRKATYVKPFYIGKLLSIMDIKTNQSYIDNVVEYSFSKIKLKNVKPGTMVKVTHLSVAPHYQMGAMVHLNRIKKKISEKSKQLVQST